MAFLNMGELINHLTKEFRESATDIPFAKMRGMRNVKEADFRVVISTYLV